MSSSDFDYIIVGSGAGGGPLAANLAKSGFKVLLMEAGDDPCSADDKGRLMYEVPIFHGLSTEYKPCSWEYYVRHFSDPAQQEKDTKKVLVDGEYKIWYPRAGALGGCTAHNALITVIPQDSDWSNIAAITGDASWAPAKMRSFFERLENCKYVHHPGRLEALVRGVISSVAEFFTGKEDWRDRTHGHGFDGWLTTSEADPKLVLKDKELIALLLDAVVKALHDELGHALTGIESRFDPNDSRYSSSSPEGLAFTPLTVDNGKRNGPRDYILRVQEEWPDNLTVRQNVFVTRVLFDGTRAMGVEYIDKAHVYAADPNAIHDAASLPRSEVHAKREIILAAGAFNSPQLLMLSGVGPRAELERFGIPVVADLPGVGENLQDRYEIGVISEFERDFALLEGGTFSLPNPGPDVLLKQWEHDGTGVYASNGSLVGIIRRSNPKLKEPDLYIFGLPGFFRGYKPHWSELTEQHHNIFTWAILKARTQNTGRVLLKSAAPWDTPEINFQYFGDGQRQNDPDMDALVSGVNFARSMNKWLHGAGLINRETVPGADLTGGALREFIKDEAWGHHASCTNKIGADSDGMAVLDSRFRVRKTQGLRVVDASVFPKIPGYFIVSAIYMISEKAFDAIMEDAGA
jgi:choline dehydrogenase